MGNNAKFSGRSSIILVFLTGAALNLWLWTLALRKPVFIQHNVACICEQKRFVLDCTLVVGLLFCALWLMLWD